MMYGLSFTGNQLAIELCCNTFFISVLICLVGYMIARHLSFVRSAAEGRSIDLSFIFYEVIGFLFYIHALQHLADMVRTGHDTV